MIVWANFLQIKTTKDDGSCYSNFTSSLNCDSYKGSASGCSMGLFFENKCKYPTTIAVRALLAKDEAAGFCLDTPHSKGDWCMPALVSLAPGANTSNAVVHTDNTVYYYFAQATDDKGRTTWWSGDTSDSETNWYDIKAGNMCKEGSSDNCRPFKKVSFIEGDAMLRCCAGQVSANGGPRAGLVQVNTTKCYETYTRSLSCDKSIDCSIANCQTYDSRMQVCECEICKPGFWGSQCSPVSRGHRNRGEMCVGTAQGLTRMGTTSHNVCFCYSAPLQTVRPTPASAPAQPVHQDIC